MEALNSPLVAILVVAFVLVVGAWAWGFTWSVETKSRTDEILDRLSKPTWTVSSDAPENYPVDEAHYLHLREFYPPLRDSWDDFVDEQDIEDDTPIIHIPPYYWRSVSPTKSDSEIDGTGE
jgi:hypothetical protein